MTAKTAKLRLAEVPVAKLAPKDLEQCYRLVRNIKYMYVNAHEGWDRSRKIDEMKNTEGLRYVVYYAGDRVAAFASFVCNDELPGLDDGLTFLWEIHVHPKYRRIGLGERLLKRVSAAAAAAGDSAVALRCFTSNRRATQFYAKMGFVDSGADAGDKCVYLWRKET